MADEQPAAAAPSSAPPAAPAAASAPSSPAAAAPAPSAPPSSSRLNDLTSDLLPAERPAPSPEPQPTPEPAPVPEPSPAGVRADQRIKIRGKEYTFAEILENDFLQQALLQTYEQFPSLQKKYTEMLEQQRQQPPTPPPPQIDPRLEQAQLVSHYAPQIAQVVKEGRIEEDFAQLYPNAVAQMLWHRDQLYQLGNAFNEFRTANAGQTRKAEATGHQNQLMASLDGLAAKGEVFAPLKDARERAGFLDFMIEMGDPPVSRLTPEYLARMWVAFKHETIVTAAQAAAAREQTERANQRLRAASDGKGSRPTPAPAGTPTLLDSLTEPFLPRR